jgi:hypothetical protein
MDVRTARLAARWMAALALVLALAAFGPAEHGQLPAAPMVTVANGYCEDRDRPIDLSGPQRTGWSPDRTNASYQPDPGSWWRTCRGRE